MSEVLLIVESCRITVDEQNPAPPLVLVFWKYLIDNKNRSANPHARDPPKTTAHPP